VANFIDGRDAVAAHGPREMPIGVALLRAREERSQAYPVVGAIFGKYSREVENYEKSERKEKTTMKRLSIFLATVLLMLSAATLPATRAIAQQAAVTDDNLDQAIANAKTPANHEAIAAFYEQEAADTKKKADLHRRSAETYRKSGLFSRPVGMPGMGKMCDNVAAMWDQIAADTEKLAKEHHEMAKKAAAPTRQ
jgi:hypothetical protein